MDLKKILVGTDFSTPNGKALEYASAVARETGATLVIVLLILFQTVRTSNADDWAQLKTSLPDSINSILVVDAEALFNSPLGKMQGWNEKDARRNPMSIPSNARQFLLGSELDIDHLEPMRQWAIITLSEPMTINDVQLNVGGRIERFDDLEGLRMESGSFIVRMQPDRLAVARQAQRQWVAQQLRSEGDPKLSSVLEEAITRVRDGDCSVALATYLADAIPRSTIRNALERSRPEWDDKVVAQLVDEFQGTEGFVLTFRITDKIHGQLDLVFRDKIRVLRNADIAKPLLLEMLANVGASVPDFGEWQHDSVGNRLRLDGSMSLGGMRRILSLLSVDSSDIAALRQDAYRDTVRPTAGSVATKRYVAVVAKLVETIADGARSNDLLKQLLWTDRVAKKISALSTRDVDPRAVELGGNVAEDLIEIVTTFQAANERVMRQSLKDPPPVEWRFRVVPYRSFTTPYGRYYRYRPLGFAQINVHENATRHRQRVADEFGKANDQSKSIFDQIETTVKKMQEIAP